MLPRQFGPLRELFGHEPPCVRGTEVTHYQVIGGGHTWPGAVAPSGPGHTTQTISATAVMWEFFTRHPLDRPAHPGGW
ncbi:hypothetical protein [Kitasatospora aureofaciens]|uniref:hypothetical protein n=1 Tax=Kitasatospora aureofaciens TaxID=1894 RepID=UPI0005262714|nr:hypothetical protein [Kitasatospora aureofaciens]